MQSWLLGIVTWAAATLVVAGCGGGGKSDTPLPDSTAASPVASATSEGTPAPPTIASPAVNSSTYTFTRKGFAVDAPPGWTAQPDQLYDVAGALFPTDAFVAPDVVDGLRPNISITCEKRRADQATTLQYRDGWQAFLKTLVGVDVTPQEIKVAGDVAYRFDYSQNAEVGTTRTSDRSDVVFARGPCRWLITLLAPADQRGDYLPMLGGVLQSFAVLP